MWGTLGTHFGRRPFIPLLLAFASGIVTSCYSGLDLRTWVLSAVLFVIGLLVKSFRIAATLFLTFLLGAALYSARYEILSENDLRLIVEDKAALVSVRGTLIETPSIREFAAGTNKIEYSYARLEVKELFIGKQWRPASGTVATTTRGVFDPEWFQGRSVEVNGIIDRPRTAEAPGLFDFRKYLFNARIFYQLRCGRTNDWQLLSFEARPLADRFQIWAHGQLARGLPGDDETLEMVRAMALGRTRSLNGEIAEVFMRTGTMHIFAISGLHVACIAACVLTVLRLLGVPRDRAAFILIPLVWFYTLATGWQSSAVRSALMSTFVFAGWAIRRPTELLNSTAGAGLLILLFEPEQLFQASFQLSFTVVAAIALFLGPSQAEESWSVQIKNWMVGYDPLLPPELRPKWKRWVEIPVGFLLGNIAISTASWLGSSPLTAYYFNLVTPISLLANLIAVPLSSVSLAATLGSLLFPPLGPLFNYLSWATMWETIATTRWLSHLSWGYFYVPKPGPFLIVVYFLIATVAVIPALRSTWTWRSLTFLAVALLGGLTMSAFSANRSTIVTLLNAPGNPVFIDSVGKSDDLLIDCSNSRSAEQLVQRFLRAQGVNRLQNLLISRGDVDHVGGFAVLQEEFSPKAVFATLLPGRSRPYRKVLDQLESLPELRKIHRGDRVGNWSVLHPARSKGFPRAEDNSVVLKGETAGWTFLFLTGLGSAGQGELVDSGSDVRADILLTSPSSRGDWLRPDLLERIQPQLIFLASAEPRPNANAKNSEKQLLRMLSDVPVISAGREGAIQLKINENECRVTTSAGSNYLFEKKR